MLAKSIKIAGAKKAQALAEQFQRYGKSSKHFKVKAALAQENTPEARKQSKKLSDVHLGSRFPHPGLYYQPNGALSARG